MKIKHTKAFIEGGASLRQADTIIVLDALQLAKKFVKTCEYRAGGPEDSGYYEFDADKLKRLRDAIDKIEGKK